MKNSPYFCTSLKKERKGGREKDDNSKGDYNREEGVFGTRRRLMGRKKERSNCLKIGIRGKGWEGRGEKSQELWHAEIE